MVKHVMHITILHSHEVTNMINRIRFTWCVHVNFTNWQSWLAMRWTRCWKSHHCSLKHFCHVALRSCSTVIDTTGANTNVRWCGQINMMKTIPTTYKIMSIRVIIAARMHNLQIDDMYHKLQITAYVHRWNWAQLNRTTIFARTRIYFTPSPLPLCEIAWFG